MIRRALAAAALAVAAVPVAASAGGLVPELPFDCSVHYTYVAGVGIPQYTCSG